MRKQGLVFLTAFTIAAVAGAGAFTFNRNMRPHGRQPRGAFYTLLHTLPTTCDGAAITGSNGEAVTVTRTTAGYCTNANGTLTSVSSGNPRVGANGLMIEPATTNILLRSSQFNTTWAGDNATLIAPVVTANTTQSPLSTTDVTADQVAFPDSSGGVGRSVLAQTVTTTAQKYTLSVWAKAHAAGDIGKEFDFYLSDGTIYSHSCALTAAWQQCYVTSSANLAAGSTVAAFGYNAAATDSAEQAAFSVDLWGAQVEARQGVTSVVDTSSSSATRQADRVVATITNPNGADCSSGKISFIMTPAGLSVPFVGDGQGYWVDTRNPSGSVDGVNLLRDTSIKFSTINHTTANQQSLSDPTASSIFASGTPATMLFTWTTGSRILKKGGTSILSDSDTTHMPTVCQSTFSIGSISSSSATFTNASFKDFAFYRLPTD